MGKLRLKFYGRGIVPGLIRLLFCYEGRIWLSNSTCSQIHEGDSSAVSMEAHKVSYFVIKVRFKSPTPRG